MESERAQVVAALAEAFFPALGDEAVLARGVGREQLARLLETSGGSLNFVVSEASQSPLHDACKKSSLGLQKCIGHLCIGLCSPTYTLIALALAA